MKKILMVATALMAMMAQCAATLIDGYVNSETVIPGQWNSNFSAVKRYADENHVPLLMFYGSTTCGYCDTMISKGLNSTVFRDWVKTHPICLVFQHKTTLTADSAKAFVKEGQTSRNLPYMKIYWHRATGQDVNVAFNGRLGAMPSKVGSTHGEQLTNSLELTIGEYFKLKTPKSQFAAGKTDFDRLECETATKTVLVPIVRTGELSQASEDSLIVGGVTQTIKWASNQGSTNVAVSVSGKTVVLTLKNASGEVTDTTSITFVDRETSAANPLWIGEKFGFGEWTCDLDGAKDLVAMTDGEAYTLVSIQGSMWCPDCANTDRNFLEVTDKSGQNVFQAWAKAKNVALVSMDIPNYKGSNVVDHALPTLFSTNAYATILARASEYPQSGADESLTTNNAVRSGLGYLSRKGVTPAEAEAVLKKFHALAVTNTDEGGFHRPEDGNPYRTGVPIFVLLRKDGTVAARFTRFASVSPMAADRANVDNYLKRFDEMLALAAASGDHADATEIENNYPGAGAIPLKANGGSVTADLCNADFQDAFKLVGFGGNGIQRVSLTGSSEAEVSVRFWQKNADGTFGEVGSAQTAKISDGLNLTGSFTESGEYYVMVKGVSITSVPFNATNSIAQNFQTYTLTGATVLVPQEDLASANAPEGQNVVTMRVVKDTVYRFSGVDAVASAAIFELLGTNEAYSFCRAKVSGDVEVTLSAGLGGQLYYQIWKSGQIGFVETEKSVPESINDLNDDWVEFTVARTDGKSGRVVATVSVDANSTLTPDRYVLDGTNAAGAVELIWKDGISTNMILRVKILDDLYYEGDCSLVLKLSVDASEAGDVTVSEGKDAYTLTVLEDDKAEPGRGQITRTTPNTVSKGKVYARANEGAKIWAERIEAWDGLVAAELTSSVAGTTFATENPRDLEVLEDGTTLLYWSSRESDEKYVQVGGIPAGKSAKIQLKSYDKFKTVAGANSVTIVSVADDAPGFTVDEASFDVYRYVSVSELEIGVTNVVEDNVSFTKLSGTLPSGLKAVWNEERKTLSFTGQPTGKPGLYEVAYQIVEKRDGRKVSGLTTTVSFTVIDPTDVKTNPDANPAVAEARTFKSVPVLFGNQMIGLLQITIPTKGNVSAKYTSAVGTVQFSAGSWGAFDPEDKTLSTVLTCRLEGYQLHVSALADGKILANLTDPNYEVNLETLIDWEPWSSQNPADGWEGYYTVACPVMSVAETVTNLASRGSGYLTLKMNTKSAIKTGTFTWAGMLPNGVAVSGSAPLAKSFDLTDDEGNVRTWANLPIFGQKKSDYLSSYVRICKNAQNDQFRRCVLAAQTVNSEDCLSWWLHSETVAQANYRATMRTYGSYYDKDENLGGCCEEFFQQNELELSFDTTQLDWLSVGVPGEVTPVNVDVLEHSMKIASETNPSKVTLSFVRSTGVVKGTALLPYTTASGVVKTLKVNYQGIVLTGWGEGCGCGDYGVFRPFVNGSFYFTEKMSYEDKGSSRTLKVARGGEVKMDKPKTQVD